MTIGAFTPEEEVVEIRKYSNRRLYDTSASRYVKLSDVAQMIREGREISVVDAKTGEDLTRVVMLQIICESKSERELLPIQLLRQVIQGSTSAVRGSVQELLQMGMHTQKEVQNQVAHWMRLGMMANPLMGPLMSALGHLGKREQGKAQPPGPGVDMPSQEGFGSRDEDIAQLQAQLLSIQEQIESLREDKE